VTVKYFKVVFPQYHTKKLVSVPEIVSAIIIVQKQFCFMCESFSLRWEHLSCLYFSWKISIRFLLKRLLAGGVPLVVKRLPSKFKTLSSNPSTTKKSFSL
jgi:hypothetical protein